MLTELKLTEVPDTGASILLDHAGAGVARTASGRFLRLQSPPPRLVGTLAGTDEGTTQSREHAADLSAELQAREAADAQIRWPARRRQVVLIGTGEVPDDVAAALQQWEVCVTRHRNADEFDAARDQGSDLVIAYAAVPADRDAWAGLDRLPKAGTAWLRAYREGEICFVDPVSVTEDDPTSEHVRRRRLAASLVPEELAAWQAAAPTSNAPLPVAARAWCVARILSVAAAWAQDTPEVERYRRTLWKLVPATGTKSEHPVIAYPTPYAPDARATRR
ncbi:MAG: hypothetical protein ACTMKZ_00665 [Brevibacterium aurantiacum]|uniref:Uncharacterized protein n=2 Tax=Brevibacterium TaxID=1696 RepID=A0A2H1IYZ9_BREAU|nr:MULTISPECIES: hypothetical protein [Actinomycetes]MDN6327924.1 hypothetical protein [Brachybacterium sp.]MDN5718752.1 hypothetical protein [Corynebacterium sp.]MDN6323856.1 hypothetical protein [Corynebacterium sp.]PCC46261.1 hypothetical protein CIK64_11835 [Brevibacterium aurantiacum]RCS96695.1 hypothetical protein CIK61_05530 [Brevibacterium aurantiacum]